jgi:dUTP pyrophosphatase
MPEIEMKLKKIEHDGVNISLPKRGTEGSAGMDLFAAICEPIAIAPGGLVRIPTGIAIGLPGDGCVGLVYARSGLAIKHGIALSNGVGVIDSDYRGEIIVGLCNVSGATYTVEPGERIAQLVIAPVYTANIIETDNLDKTGREAGGFGSTGRY